MARSLRNRSLRSAAAALVALGVHAVVPAALADPPEAGGTCPANAQRGRLASTPEKIQEIQQRIAAQAKPGSRIVVLSNSGYSYAAPAPGAEAAALEFESKQLEAPTPAR